MQLTSMDQDLFNKFRGQDTSFENKKSAVELVTFVREKDGYWRAAGYYIK